MAVNTQQADWALRSTEGTLDSVPNWLVAQGQRRVVMVQVRTCVSKLGVTRFVVWVSSKAGRRQFCLLCGVVHVVEEENHIWKLSQGFIVWSDQAST